MCSSFEQLPQTGSARLTAVLRLTLGHTVAPLAPVIIAVYFYHYVTARSTYVTARTLTLHHLILLYITRDAPNELQSSRLNAGSARALTSGCHFDTHCSLLLNGLNNFNPVSIYLAVSFRF